MDDLNEIENGQLCQETIQALSRTVGGLKYFPGLLKKIIVNKSWQCRVNMGTTIELGSLRELITEFPIRGWGEDPKKIEAVIKDDPEVLAMFREAMKQQGNNQYTKSKGDNASPQSLKMKGEDASPQKRKVHRRRSKSECRKSKGSKIRNRMCNQDYRGKTKEKLPLIAPGSL